MHRAPTPPNPTTWRQCPPPVCRVAWPTPPTDRVNITQPKRPCKRCPVDERSCCLALSTMGVTNLPLRHPHKYFTPAPRLRLLPRNPKRPTVRLLPPLACSLRLMLRHAGAHGASMSAITEVRRWVMALNLNTGPTQLPCPVYMLHSLDLSAQEETRLRRSAERRMNSWVSVHGLGICSTRDTTLPVRLRSNASSEASSWLCFASFK
jgi:hypothetical protein